MISKTMQAAMAARAYAHAQGELQDEWATKLIGILPDGQAARALFDQASNGMFSHNIVVRSRFFERTLCQWQAWATDLVCVSGGLDLHLISMPQAKGLNKYFLDLPTSLGLLRRSVAQTGGNADALGIEFGEVDLNQSDALAGTWARQSGPALVFWEGASYYLPPMAIRALIQRAGASSKPLKLIFDCLYKDGYLVDGRPRNEGIARNLAFVAQIGEPWLGFVSREEIVTWAHEAGFSSIQIADRAFVEQELTGSQKLAKGQMMFVTLEK